MNFQALVETSTREKDNMVNATRYCKAFGKRLDRWLENKESSVLLQTISQQLGVKAAGSKDSKIPQIPGIIETRRNSSKH